MIIVSNNCISLSLWLDWILCIMNVPKCTISRISKSQAHTSAHPRLVFPGQNEEEEEEERYSLTISDSGSAKEREKGTLVHIFDIS